MNKKDETNSANRSFSEAHPALNVLLSLFILFVVFWGVQYLFKQIGELLIWMLSTVSKLDAVVIVALITGAVSIIGVVISSVFSKYIEYKKTRQNYLAQKREVPYGQFIDMIYKMQKSSKNNETYTQEEMISDISKFSKQLTLWGSHRVVNKWVEFREKGADPKSAKENLFLMDDIMNEMRHDLGLKKVKKGNLLAFFINDIKKTMKEMKK